MILVGWEYCCNLQKKILFVVIKRFDIKSSIAWIYNMHNTILKIFRLNLSYLYH